MSIETRRAWLPHPPNHWRTPPLWSLFRRLKDTNHPGEQMLSVFRDHGVVLKDSRSNLNVTAENRDIYQLVHPGWLLVNRMKAWQGSVGVSTHRGIVSGHYLCFAPLHSEDARYLNYLLRSRPYADGYGLMSRGVRIGQAEIDNDLFRQMPVLLPPVAEQRSIADYLDRETAQIDALIGKQERLIETLRERRAAVIEQLLASHLVGRSGSRLKHYVVQVNQGWSPQCFPWPADGVETWAVLKTGAPNGGRFRALENKELPATEAPRPDTVVRRGQIVVARASTRDLVGSAAVVDGDYPRLMLSDKLYALSVNPAVASADYVCRVLGTRRWRDLLQMEATGTSPSMQNVSLADILNLPLDLPEPYRQRKILSQLDEQTAKIDALIGKAERFIELSKERRAALITAAVTGQIDVREAV